MKQNIQPKVKTSLKMSTTMKAAVAGGILTVLLTAAFFIYSNLQHKDALANGTEINSITNGSWSAPTTWNLNRAPFNGDVVIVAAGRTVSVNSPIQFNGTIKVYGTLLFTNGKITMDENSEIMIHEDGELISAGPGTSDKLTIGNYVWQGSTISDINSPNLLNFSGSMGGNPLPVTLISFNATNSGNAVRLDWETAMELNNESFSIQRSGDGSDFTDIGLVYGAGTTTERVSYDFYDERPLPRENYYRLKQTDLDGKFEYSKVIHFRNEIASTIEVLNVGPNPFKQDFTVEFKGETDGEVNMILTNASGAIVHQEMIRINTGRNKFSFSDNKNLPNGIYFITIHDKDQKFSRKLIKG